MGIAEFTRALVRALDESGLNQTEVARATGGAVSQGTISGWRKGNAHPQPDSVFAVERALGLAPGQLSRHLGYVPTHTLPAGPDVLTAIDADTSIGEDAKQGLRLLYLVSQAESGARPRERIARTRG